jgi:hypothetical protein
VNTASASPVSPAAAVPTPTIGSVRPVPQRNLFGVPPSPPCGPPLAGRRSGTPVSSPRARLGRLASALIGGTKRPAVGLSSPSAVMMSDGASSSPSAPVAVAAHVSPAAHVPISGSGARGERESSSVMSEGRRRAKRRGVTSAIE